MLPTVVIVTSWIGNRGAAAMSASVALRGFYYHPPSPYHSLCSQPVPPRCRCAYGSLPLIYLSTIPVRHSLHSTHSDRRLRDYDRSDRVGAMEKAPRVGWTNMVARGDGGRPGRHKPPRRPSPLVVVRFAVFAFCSLCFFLLLLQTG